MSAADALSGFAADALSGFAADALSGFAAAILAATGRAPSAELSQVAAGPTALDRLTDSTGLGRSAFRIPRSPMLPPPTDDGVPELFCPGPVRDDPALGETVNDGIVEWAGQVGIYPGQLDRLRAYNFGRLIMLTHPATNDPDRLLAAAKCVVAEWATDDYVVDEVSLGADPAVVGSRLAKLHAVVDPARLPARYAPQLDAYRRDEPIATAFRSAMEHLARYTTVAQLGRFQHQLGILFLAWNQEADWHVNGRTPPVWEYLVQRHLNNFLPPMVLVDAVAGYELSPDEFFDPRVRRAYTTAALANVLLNDIHSGTCESDTDFNLPRVISIEEGCSLRDAVTRTVEIHNELMHAFVADAATLSLIGSPNLRRFLADIWAWLGGSREWHATTSRYHGEATTRS
ncbi:family 2 encapsulin nanocompartment cargo protein terpene cyclase [Micromonospora olivasterospora]|uniref:2-methylisoborneol synthase n=1 Tax=Micromonospora olivasterospora TaxID=1880 RepID=F5HSX4_MICOL|nr:family 2 encapsulin nanocompartment cargo protein terpene cyclase [Micromonospora olivasterospora]BAK26793.1 2-methylenebornane synthase [Micromonospora olivasterospora]